MVKDREETEMKKEMMKRLVSWVVAAAMVVAMLPVSVLGAPVEGPVAQIGDQTYSQIPHTGGSGTLMFTIGGAMLMATAGMLLVVSRKRRKA